MPHVWLQIRQGKLDKIVVLFIREAHMFLFKVVAYSSKENSCETMLTVLKSRVNTCVMNATRNKTTKMIKISNSIKHTFHSKDDLMRSNGDF